MKKASIILTVLVAIAVTVYVLIPSGEDAAQNLDLAGAGAAKDAQLVAASAGNVVFGLDANNTKLAFSCAKQVAGKTLTVHGGWSGQFDSKLSGEVIADSEQGQVLQIQAQIDVGSLWSEHDQLTKALLTAGFFQVEQHPTATFISTTITAGRPETTSMEDATHLIEGNFKLNGIEHSISFPAKIQLTSESLQLDSQFSLDRKDYDVNFTDNSAYGLLTDENISHLVALKLHIDAVTTGQIDQSTVVESSEGEGEGEDESIAQDVAQDAAHTVDVSQLAATYTETIPATQIEFDMVLVPGDADQGCPPLYFGKHEVTWDEFMPWADGRDLNDEEAIGELRALKLRPSPPYGSVDRNFGMAKRPALGMARLAAELYCKWLCEQTGKKYRLPTEAEWEHAYVLGGGSASAPPSADDANRFSVHADNSWSDMIGDYATQPVGSTEPNAIGLFDMAGNVCEWVTGTGEEHVARGGHFDGPASELGVGRHVQDLAVWNRDDPNLPQSIWWFVNARWVGFRVVCEVPSP